MQAGGRCNREGKRSIGDVFIFDFSENEKRQAVDERANLTRGLLEKYEDISDIQCIEEYYNRLLYMNREAIQKNTMHQQCLEIDSIPFKSYAEKFSLIDSETVSLVVPRDARSEKLVELLKFTHSGNSRALQSYTCTLYQRELEDLIRQHAADDYGTGIFCLTNSDYYDENTGILFEAPDYFIS